MSWVLFCIIRGINPISYFRLRRALQRRKIPFTPPAIVAHLLTIKNMDRRVDDLISAIIRLPDSEPNADFESIAALHLSGHIGQLREGRSVMEAREAARRELERNQKVRDCDFDKILATELWFYLCLTGRTDTPYPSLSEAVERFQLSQAEVRYFKNSSEFQRLEKFRETYPLKARMPFIVAGCVVFTGLGIYAIYDNYGIDTGAIVAGVVFIGIGQIALIAALRVRKKARAVRLGQLKL